MPIPRVDINILKILDPFHPNAFWKGCPGLHASCPFNVKVVEGIGLLPKNLASPAPSMIHKPE